MNCIILAAGKNTRLDNGIPKSMLKIDEETLLDRHLRLFTKFGIEKFCIVTGYRNEVLNEFIGNLDESLRERITVAHNPRFDLPNGVSLSRAGQWVKDSGDKNFFFTMADHFFSDEFVEKAIAADPSGTTLSLVVDRPSFTNAHIDLDDVTRVESKNGLIQNIGKHLDVYDFFDTGLFHAKVEMFECLEESIREGKHSISNMVQLLIESKQASIMEVSGHFWNDVETPEDLDYMRNLELTEKLS